VLAWLGEPEQKVSSYSTSLILEPMKSWWSLRLAVRDHRCPHQIQEPFHPSPGIEEKEKLTGYPGWEAQIDLLQHGSCLRLITDPNLKARVP